MGRKKKPDGRKSKATLEVEKVEHLVTLEEDVPHLRDIPVIAMAIDEVLSGNRFKQIKENLKVAGYPCGHERLRSILDIARAEIAKEGYKDFSTNYAWAEANLKDIHGKAVASGDDRMRVVVIKELISLWQLDKHEEQDEREITPEMIEKFEQKLLR